MDHLPAGQQKPDDIVVPGQLIGSYRVEHKLGEGGMAAVFLATHERIRKRAAIKVLKPSLCHDLEITTRFLNEALAVNLIQHPGIVNIFEHGQLESGAAYIIMDYLDGVALSQLLAARRLEAAEALRLGRQVALALAAAHDQGIVHRDLKPDNVMLVTDSEGQQHAKLLDFGIAKLARAPGGDPVITQAGTILGTPAYMAPEQCFGIGSATAKSDVYALGVILYEMLAGRPPFSGTESGELLSQHVYSSPPPLQAACPDLPQPLCALVHAMLSKEPERRPAMTEVAARLKAPLRPTPAPAGRSRKGRDRVAALLLGALLLCGLGLTLAGWHHPAASPAPMRGPRPEGSPRPGAAPAPAAAPAPPPQTPAMAALRPAPPRREPPRRPRHAAPDREPTNEELNAKIELLR